MNGVPSVDELGVVLGGMGTYERVCSDNVDVLLRWSTAPRRQNSKHLDIDIVQMQTNPTRSGIGTKFVVNLIEAAKKLDRGVFLEQTITEGSRAWAAKLVREELMQPYYLDDNFISVAPDCDISLMSRANRFKVI